MKLSAYLKLSKRTATELAHECGVTVPTITRVAKGQKNPSLELMIRIRRATQGAVRADDFLPPFQEPTAELIAAQA